MSGTDFYQSVIQATWMNNKKKPIDDPRVRRAFHLVLDKPVLVDVVKDVAPMMVGGFIYPFSEFATPKAELGKRLGYQADPTASIKEAKALMKAAGYENGIKGLDYLVREVASFKLWSQAIQAMLQQTLNVAVQPAHRGRVGVVRRHRAPASSTSPSAPSSRRCSTRPTTSTPGTARAVRRTTRTGTNPEVQRAAAADRPRGRSPRSAST